MSARAAIEPGARHELERKLRASRQWAARGDGESDAKCREVLQPILAGLLVCGPGSSWLKLLNESVRTWTKARDSTSPAANALTRSSSLLARPSCIAGTQSGRKTPRAPATRMMNPPPTRRLTDAAEGSAEACTGDSKGAIAPSDGGGDKMDGTSIRTAANRLCDRQTKRRRV